MERAKNALNEQLTLRGQASSRAHAIMEEQLSARHTPAHIWPESDSADTSVDGEVREQDKREGDEITELELKIAASSKVCVLIALYGLRMT